MTKLPIFIQKLLLFCLILRGSELIAQNDIIKVRNEATINTAFQEYSPAFYQNGLIFIASNPAVATEKKEDSNTGKATTSLFFATRNAAGILQNPAPFAEELTTKFYDGPLSFNNDGSMIYFTRSNLKKGKPVKAKDGLVKLKIYSAEKKDNKWLNIQVCLLIVQNLIASTPQYPAMAEGFTSHLIAPEVLAVWIYMSLHSLIISGATLSIWDPKSIPIKTRFSLSAIPMER